jgi:hypothetical protein
MTTIKELEVTPSPVVTPHVQDELVECRHQPRRRVVALVALHADHSLQPQDRGVDLYLVAARPAGVVPAEPGSGVQVRPHVALILERLDLGLQHLPVRLQRRQLAVELVDVGDGVTEQRLLVNHGQSESISSGNNPRPSTSRDTQRLYIRLNTLHYLLSHIQALDKSLSFSHSVCASLTSVSTT